MRFAPPISFRLPAALEPVDRVLRNIDQRIRQIVDVPILRGTHLADLDVTTSGTIIHHGLGRVPRGAIVVKNNRTVASYRTDEFTKTTLQVTADSGSPTISLWVY